MQTVDLTGLKKPGMDLLAHLSEQKEPVALRSLREKWRTHDLLFWLRERWLIRLVRREVGHFVAAGVGVIGSRETWGDYRSRAFQSLQEALDEDAKRDLRDSIHIELSITGQRSLIEHRIKTTNSVVGPPPKPITLPEAASIYDISVRTLQRRLEEGVLTDLRGEDAERGVVVMVDENEVANLWRPKK